MFRIGEMTWTELNALKRTLAHANKVFDSKYLKALSDAADIARKHFGRQFATEGSEFGTAWPQLKESTNENRQRRGYKPAHPILVNRGYLRASIVSKQSANHRYEINLHGIKLYSALQTKSGLNLMMLHQDGTPKMPARKIYGPKWISEQGWREIKYRFLGMFIEIRREMQSVR